MLVNYNFMEEKNMIKTVKCPVCHTNMHTKMLHTNVGFLLERKLVCPAGCYTYEFLYGAIHVKVGEHLSFDADIYDPDTDKIRSMALKVRRAVRAVRLAYAFRDYKSMENKQLMLEDSKNEAYAG